jgi:hypothetical protein
MTYRLKAPAIIDANMATVEQLYTGLGADRFAKLMAEALRNPEPRREILDAIARLLDPHPDDDLRLVVERRSRGNRMMRWTKRAKDIHIALAVLNFEEEWDKSGKPRRGRRKNAVDETSKRAGIGKGTVREALKILSKIPTK